MLSNLIRIVPVASDLNPREFEDILRVRNSDGNFEAISIHRIDSKLLANRLSLKKIKFYIHVQPQLIPHHTILSSYRVSYRYILPYADKIESKSKITSRPEGHTLL